MTTKNPQNRDPITGEPGSHPVGVGTGTAAGASTGAAIGAVGGPVGAVVGAVVGGVAGAVGGKAVAESLNPTVEDEYWRGNYSSRPYVEKGQSYDEYAPAYRAGYEGYQKYGSKKRPFNEVEPDLRRDYESTGKSSMSWEKAKAATRDAWNRAEEMLPGDLDGDGR